MIAATLFSGIGAPEVAMRGWRWPWHAEIEKFPSAVMAARHPGSINLGDVSADDFAERAAEIARPDVLVFGSPCQDFSVAGRRAGLAGKRGNLSMVALDILSRLRPRWFAFENVPGLLSIDDGRGFRWFLRRVDELGYLGAWTSLDAQYFGLAQRRNRVFFVGHSGDWRHPAAILLEPKSLCGDHPPRRQKGEGVAPTIASRPTGGGGLGTDFCLNAGGMGRIDYESETFVTHALRADGFDASEDGTGRGTPLITFSSKDHGADAGSIAPTLRAMGHSGSHANAGGQVAIAFDTTQVTSKLNRNNPSPGDPCHPLAAGAHAPAIAFQSKASASQSMNPSEIAPTLDVSKHDGMAVAVALRGREGGGTAELSDVPSALRASTGGGDKAHVLTSSVRRLTPRECERLQGFPDDYTLIEYRGKPAADGPRYKALGNSMAVPVMRWILSRIEQMHKSR